MTLVIQAEPRVDIDSDLYLYMDLWHGECRDMRLVAENKGSKVGVFSEIPQNTGVRFSRPGRY